MPRLLPHAHRHRFPSAAFPAKTKKTFPRVAPHLKRQPVKRLLANGTLRFAADEFDASVTELRDIERLIIFHTGRMTKKLTTEKKMLRRQSFRYTRRNNDSIRHPLRRRRCAGGGQASRFALSSRIEATVSEFDP